MSVSGMCRRLRQIAAGAAATPAEQLELDELVDLAESRLAAAVRRGERWAVELVLRSLGRDRGYGEPPEKTDADLNAAIEAELARVASERERARLAACQQTFQGATDR
jgi:hypothetical protein